MKPKHLSLAMAALVVVGGFWLVQSAWHRNSSKLGISHESRIPGTLPVDSNAGADVEATASRSESGEMLRESAQPAPPIPNRRFTDFTPEQRVQFARQGHGPGG